MNFNTLFSGGLGKGGRLASWGVGIVIAVSIHIWPGYRPRENASNLQVLIHVSHVSATGSLVVQR